MAQQNATLADDYTEFNGDFPTLLVGKTMSTRMGRSRPTTRRCTSELQNGRVQVYGDTAILTYNFAGPARGGWQGQPVACQIDAGLCEAGRPVEAGPRQLLSGGSRALIRAQQGRVHAARSLTAPSPATAGV